MSKDRMPTWAVDKYGECDWMCDEYFWIFPEREETQDEKERRQAKNRKRNAQRRRARQNSKP